MPFSYSFHNSNFTSVAQIVTHMQLLDNRLANTDLHNLIAFNHTYLIITQSVMQKIGTGYFEDDARMQSFDILFAQYYFDAIYNFVCDQPTAPAWKLLFEQCRHGQLMQWQYLALGVNAHVNNDLPLALSQSNYQESYQRDYFKINDILHSQIPTIITSFNEQNYIINSIKNFCMPVYRPALKRVIRTWRDHAWTSYTKLRKLALTPSQVARNARHVGLVITFGKGY